MSLDSLVCKMETAVPASGLSQALSGHTSGTWQMCQLLPLWLLSITFIQSWRGLGDCQTPFSPSAEMETEVPGNPATHSSGHGAS